MLRALSLSCCLTALPSPPVCPVQEIYHQISAPSQWGSPASELWERHFFISYLVPGIPIAQSYSLREKKKFKLSTGLVPARGLQGESISTPPVSGLLTFIAPISVLLSHNFPLNLTLPVSLQRASSLLRAWTCDFPTKAQCLRLTLYLAPIGKSYIIGDMP